ncbi:MAG TPA: T9SS type A sorting domain-containing protein [Puia sp.]|jgi:hypothetical protein
MKNVSISSPGKLLLLLWMGVILHLQGSAQCLNNLGTRSYDTTLTGIGYGNYTIRVPKWNPDSGLLVSVKISALVSVQYGFTLKDVDVNPSIYTLTAGREDYISSPALAHPYDNDLEQRIGVFPLNPGQSVSQAPFSFLTNYANTDSITDNVAPFLGVDSVSLTYSPITYSDLRTNNNSSYAYHAAAQDTMQFSVSYLYCKSSVTLATDLTAFAAVWSGSATVQLTWSSANEKAGRQYEIQRSADGQHFETVGTVDAKGGAGGTGDYGYADRLTMGMGGMTGTGGTTGTGGMTGTGGTTGMGGTTGTGGMAGTVNKWYYRLRIDDPGALMYSGVRVVTMNGDAVQGLQLYPNPAVGFINLVVGRGAGTSVVGGSGGIWQVDILGADGSLVQRAVYRQAGTIRVDFQHVLSAGTYFVRIVDLPGQHSQIVSFIVTGAR